MLKDKGYKVKKAYVSPLTVHGVMQLKGTLP